MERVRRCWPAFWILGFVLLGNVPILSGLAACNPERFYSGLILGPIPHRNFCFLDASVALYTQALGGLAAHDWLHGIVPWWNPYTGIGMPLAGEVQDEAFFLPFVLLLHNASGWFWQRLLFQLIAGLFTYRFLRLRALGRPAATLGAVLFALNGTFYVNAGTASAPLFFLPILLMGLERARRAADRNAQAGWSLIVLGLAGSLYAGFPEVAFFDGLLGLAWAVLLAAGAAPAPRARFAGKVLLGGTIGLALTAPLLVPFAAYLRLGDVSLHTGFFAHLAYPAASLPLQMFPLFYGAIAPFAPPGAPDLYRLLWGAIGGWFGCAPVALALGAMLAGHRAAPRYVLGGWVLLWAARCFGAGWVVGLVNLLPGVAAANAARYAVPSATFALFALAAYGADDLLRGFSLRGWRFAATVAAVSAAALLCLIPGFRLAPDWFARVPPLFLWSSAASLAGGLGCAAAVLAAYRTGRFRRAALGLVLAEALALFWAPQLGAPRRLVLDDTGVGFLRAHAGLSRYLSLGPLGGNFPAQDGIAGLNTFQIPSPSAWDLYYQRTLLGRTPDPFLGQNLLPAALTAIVPWRLAAFAGAGTKYIGVWPFMDPWKDAPPPRVPQPAAPLRYRVLPAGATLDGAVAGPAIPGTTVYGAWLTLGTFRGRANGPLRLSLCAGIDCASAATDLTVADDNATRLFVLDRTLPVAPGATVRVSVAHPAGSPVAVAVAGAGGGAPALTLQSTPPATAPLPVFHSRIMTIYELPDAAPYASASLPSCDLVIKDRQHFRTDCPAPATLLRRELYYPGWRARVNGRRAPVTPVDGLFQGIALPAGPARISLYYLPTYTGLSLLAAVAALLLWLAFAGRAAFSNPGQAGTPIPPRGRRAGPGPARPHGEAG